MNQDFFKLDNSTDFIDLGTPYDYKSIMHYHSRAHAKDNNSITIRLKNHPYLIRDVQELSDIDVMEIRKLYNCRSGKIIFKTI